MNGSKRIQSEGRCVILISYFFCQKKRQTLKYSIWIYVMCQHTVWKSWTYFKKCKASANMQIYAYWGRHSSMHLFLQEKWRINRLHTKLCVLQIIWLTMKSDIIWTAAQWEMFIINSISDKNKRSQTKLGHSKNIRKKI